MSSWVIDPEALIIEVESRPILYCKSLPEYANKTMKNDAWKDIAKQLSVDWDTLTNNEKNSRSKDTQNKWKHLRDCFRREYQAQRHGKSGQGTKKRKQYRYYDQLRFLIPYAKDANTSGNYSPPSSELSTATHNISQTPNKEKKTFFEDTLLKAINCEMSTDEDKTFCLSLVQPLKKLDYNNKMLAKIELLKVIRHYSNRPRETHNGSRVHEGSKKRQRYTLPQHQIHTPSYQTIESIPTISIRKSKFIKIVDRREAANIRSTCNDISYTQLKTE